MRHDIFGKPRWTGRLLFVLALAGVCGCGHTATISGKVTCQGRPVCCGAVIFLSADKTYRSAVIQLDGSYTVEGVPSGVVQIGVVSRDPSKNRTAVPGRKPLGVSQKRAGFQGRMVEGWFPLPAKYELPGNPDLAFTVASGHVSHDIDLK